jgi:Protein of unknown function DUF2625
MDSLAWTLLQRWIAEAGNDVTVLPAEGDAVATTLEALGVNDRSVLGALAANTGGLTIDRGWLSVLGGPGLLEWRDKLDDELVVGHDVVAGFYAVDKQEGEVRYLAPDTLEWVGTEMGHSEWVHWTLAGDLAGFYATLRWPGWEEESAPLAPDTGLMLDPPPFSRAGRVIAEVTRKPAAVAKLWGVQQEYVRDIIGD